MTPEQLMEMLRERGLVNVVAKELNCSRNSVSRRVLSTNPFLALRKLEAIRVATNVLNQYSDAVKEADTLLENIPQMEAA